MLNRLSPWALEVLLFHYQMQARNLWSKAPGHQNGSVELGERLQGLSITIF